MPEAPVQLHLGCGKRYIPGFTHVDLSDFPHIAHRRDVADLEPFTDASVDLIYASHVLEYFDRVEATTVLAEWRRVLRIGGTLRLAVPDFAALARVYQQTGNLDLVVGPLYGRMMVGASDQATYRYHRTVYDFDSLKRVLASAGFTNVRRYDWRQTIHRDYDDFSQAYVPHMDKEKGLLISLNVEADRT
jgi:predicted SAM-dependent methyltransferase